MTHICVSKLAIIGSDNGLSPGRREAVNWTNAGILLIRTLGTNFNEILIEVHTFSLKNALKMSSAKWRQFFLGLNVLMARCEENRPVTGGFPSQRAIYGEATIITWLCDILALVWHFGPACVTFRPGLCDILALSCVTKASACHHTPILTTGAVYRKFHRSSVSKTT